MSSSLYDGTRVVCQNTLNLSVTPLPQDEVVIRSYTVTCDRFPVQIEGRLSDGRFFYFRSRSGSATIGLGDSPDGALMNITAERVGVELELTVPEALDLIHSLVAFGDSLADAYWSADGDDTHYVTAEEALASPALAHVASKRAHISLTLR